jgi:hypothetical protein
MDGCLISVSEQNIAVQEQVIVFGWINDDNEVEQVQGRSASGGTGFGVTS